MTDQLNRQLLADLAASPTAFHAVATAAAKLDNAGFARVDAASDWALQGGGKYYFTVNDSTLIAFRLPQGMPTGFIITASHSDSPTFKLKANPRRTAAGRYVQLNTERYGGMLLSTWFDRPLGIAGRLLVEEGGRIVSRLVYPQQNLAIIPSVAPHLNSEANTGFKLNAAVDTYPLFSTAAADGDLMALLAGNAGVTKEQILSHDLYLVCRDGGTTVGSKDEFLCSPRLDDLSCAFGCLEGFLTAAGSDAAAVYCLFDNEEVGSSTKQGAASSVLRDTLRRIFHALGGGEAYWQKLLLSSFLVSADNAHARHPNHGELSDEQNCPYLNGGLVVKYNANQRYTTDGVSDALLGQLCREAGVPLQRYANRSDLPGGSTLGSIATTQVPIRAVDIGLAQLAMHSCYETMGSQDYAHLVNAVTTLYSHSLHAEGSSWLWK